MRQQCSNCFNDYDDDCICFDCMEQVVYALRDIQELVNINCHVDDQLDKKDIIEQTRLAVKRGLKGIDIL